MRLIIAGSRDITDICLVRHCFRAFWYRFCVTEIVSGAARGVDRLGVRVGREHLITPVHFPAEWDRLGRRIAGSVRNQEMADYADALLAIWDEQSSGTRDMIQRARDKGLYVEVYNLRGTQIAVYNAA